MGFAEWLKKEIDDEEFYSGGPRPVERLAVLREVQEKLRLSGPTLESHMTVADVMRGTFLTSRGQPQRGVAFVCQEHGVQPFHAIVHLPGRNGGIELDCGCHFVIDQDTGAVSK